MYCSEFNFGVMILKDVWNKSNRIKIKLLRFLISFCIVMSYSIKKRYYRAIENDCPGHELLNFKELIKNIFLNTKVNDFSSSVQRTISKMWHRDNHFRSLCTFQPNRICITFDRNSVILDRKIYSKANILNNI